MRREDTAGSRHGKAAVRDTPSFTWQNKAPFSESLKAGERTAWFH